MFKRIGMPEELKVVNFDGADSKECTCPKCNHVIGRKAQGMLRAASERVVNVGTRQVCSKCGTEFNV